MTDMIDGIFGLVASLIALYAYLGWATGSKTFEGAVMMMLMMIVIISGVSV